MCKHVVINIQHANVSSAQHSSPLSVTITVVSDAGEVTVVVLRELSV